MATRRVSYCRRDQFTIVPFPFSQYSGPRCEYCEAARKAVVKAAAEGHKEKGKRAEELLVFNICTIWGGGGGGAYFCSENNMGPGES